MGKSHRLTKARDFSSVRLHGQSLANRLVVLIVERNNLGVSRIGISVSKRVGKAVTRNKVKRRLKEASRLIPIEEGWDLVIIARKHSSEASFRTLSGSVAAIIQYAASIGILSQPDCCPTKRI